MGWPASALHKLEGDVFSTVLERCWKLSAQGEGPSLRDVHLLSLLCLAQEMEPRMKFVLVWSSEDRDHFNINTCPCYKYQPRVGE